jgi:hypothetical protein
MVIYDGLHYDALAIAAYEGAPEALDVTVIPSSGPRTDMVMEVGGVDSSDKNCPLHSNDVPALAGLAGLVKVERGLDQAARVAGASLVHVVCQRISPPC